MAEGYQEMVENLLKNFEDQCLHRRSGLTEVRGSATESDAAGDAAGGVNIAPLYDTYDTCESNAEDWRYYHGNKPGSPIRPICPICPIWS